MNRFLWPTSIVFGTLFFSPACSPGPARSPAANEDVDRVPVPCTELVDFAAPGLVVESAEKLLEPEAEPNPYTGEPMPALAPHCKVSGVIDDEIHFELRLPLEDAWNGRFAMGGGGGFVGSVIDGLLTPAPKTEPVLDAGSATVGTDTGHQGSVIDASWALDDDVRVA